MAKKFNFEKGLRILKGKIPKYKIFGFDIETCNNNKDFVCCSIVGDNYKKFFTSIDDLKQELLNNRIFSNSFICATNLMFDFFGVFSLHDTLKYFNIIERSGSLMYAKTYTNYDKNSDVKKGFYKFSNLKHMKRNKIIDSISNNFYPITFMDSGNHLRTSVKNLGKIVGLPKIKIDDNLIGNMPKNKKEWEIMKEYNIRDSEITFLFMNFLQDNYNKLGARLKITISATALDLFRRSYLNGFWKQEERNKINMAYPCYYGGRTEAFKRGIFNKDNFGKISVYDVNCFSADTEILTENGFKKYTDIKRNDIVFSMKNDKLVKQKINKIIISKYKGNMINITNENTDMLITPNHRVYYKDYNRNINTKKGWTDWKITKADKLPKTYIKFPNAKIYNGNINISENILKLLSWYITEGCKINNKTVEISQQYEHNKKNCEEILEILKNLNIKYKEKIRIQKGKHYLYIYFDYAIIKYLLGYNNLNSYSMRLPYNFIDYSYNCKKILFNEIMKGDGSIKKGKATYVSYSNKLLEEVQILATMIGYKASVNYKNHSVHIKLNRNGDSMIDKTKNIEYTGYVWCVNVALSNIVVRRNGKIFISGNSLYPYCLKKFQFPVPDISYYKDKITTEDVENFLGIGYFELEAPKDLNIPVLPMKTDKLRFPVGVIKGNYDFNSIKMALNNGYNILSTGKGLIYENKFAPFRNMMTDLYKKRKQLKLRKDGSDIVAKLLMNGFYGKLGFNYKNKEMLGNAEDILNASEETSIIPTADEEVFRLISSEDSDIPSYVFPIMPLYVTSYARQVMYNKFKKVGFDRVLYSDTDCIFTTRKLSTSSELGDLKLEDTFEELAIIKPKFYSGITKDEKQIIKVKGLHGSLKDYDTFKDLVINDDFTVKTKHFRKLRGSIGKNDKYVNEVYGMIKSMDINDDKRSWEKKNFTSIPQNSEPILIK